MKKRKLRLHSIASLSAGLARFLLRSQLFTIFLALCLLGIWVGASTRPSPNTVPYAELFNQMSVVSYRESPSDTTARFIVELAASGKVFSEYDVDAQRFFPPSRGRAYSRTITGTHYGPLQIRGHVAQGLWLAVPDSTGRSLLPEQFDELYRSTLGFVKPVSLITSVLGTFSGYSIGYRLGTWNGSLSSRKVQERVLATPDLGRTIAREAWRRVLLEPVVMGDEDNAARFAAAHGTHRIYANFFRVALNDSDGFVAREAARLSSLGRAAESRAMLEFAEAVHHAAGDSVHLASGDFAAVERWAGLLDRRGHWAAGAIPPAGAERAQYLGTLAWYGLAPPAPGADRVWVGPRMLVRTGDTEGFVADEIPATRVGCPIAWRTRLNEENSNTVAIASAWFADRPEFPALLVLGSRVAGGLANAGRQLAANLAQRAAATAPADPRPAARLVSAPAAMPTVPMTSGITVTAAPAAADSAPRRSVSFPFRSMGTYANVIVVTADSAATAPVARAAQSAFARVDSLMSNWTTTSEVARLNREAAAGATPVQPEVARVIEVSMRMWRDSERAFDMTVEPLVRAWGFIGGPPRMPSQAEQDSAFARVGTQRVVFDAAARTLRFEQAGVKIDLGSIAKGYAVDVAADTLRAHGVRDALVDISGNMAAIGTPPHADHWRIGIRDPRDRMPYFARVLLAPGEAISTSGKYEQFVAANGKTYGHIMDPRTGKPAEGLISVTVVSPTAMTSDAWDTPLFVLGLADAKRKAREHPEFSAVLIEPGTGGVDTVWVESDLKGRFELEEQARAQFRVEFF